jgi:hypothetical protein
MVGTRIVHRTGTGEQRSSRTLDGRQGSSPGLPQCSSSFETMFNQHIIGLPSSYSFNQTVARVSRPAKTR